MPRSPRPRSAPGARVPAVVLVATVAFGALAALWSVAVPLLEAPDEPDHLALVLHLADGNPYPEFDGLQSQAAVYRMCRVYVSSIRACPRDDEVVSPTGMRRHPREQAPPKSERPAWDDLGGDEPVGALNQMPQHPPLYYQLMAGVLRVERAVNGGPWSLDRELALLRLANVALVTPLPLLAWWAARRFRLDQATAIGACFAVFAVPMLTHIGSTLNNDNLLNLCGALLVALLAGVLRGDRSLRTGLAVGAVIGVGLLTKAFAVIFPPLAVLAYAIGAVVDPDRPAWRESVARVARPLGAAGLVSIVLAGWWYVGVRLRTGSFTPTVEDAALTSALAPAGFEPRVGTFLGQFLPAVDTRFWGSYGGYPVRLSEGVAWLLTASVAAAVASALATREAPGAAPGSEPARRLATAWFLVPVAALAVLVVGRSWGIYATTSKLVFAQGRYLFAGLVALVVPVAMGIRRGAGRWTPFVLVALAAVAQAHALRRSLADYWGGPGLGPRGQVRALVAYSGWPGEVVALFGIAAAVSAGALAWTLVGLARTDPDEPDAMDRRGGLDEPAGAPDPGPARSPAVGSVAP
ncbi:MAG: DUF2142 domain-containing protein [Actinobacteria bacterium]|nr:DUF2142 domain-containing protein [Actinomycetota bacterium]